MRKIHKGNKVIACILAATIYIALLTGCGDLLQKDPDPPAISNLTEASTTPPASSMTEESASSPASSSMTEDVADPPSDDSETEYRALAQESQVFSVACGENARLDIFLPAGALGSDTLLDLKALEGGNAPGFSLNEKGGKGLTLQAPAAICYVTSGELPENACIIKYSDNGKGYTPVPSQRFRRGETSGLVAFVQSFSSYGVKVVTDEELSAMADELERTGFHWVLSVDDKNGFTETYEEEVITETIYEATLDMTLVNVKAPTPYVMHGNYQGAAKMLSDVKVRMDGAPMFFSLVEATDDMASITLYPVFQEYEPEPGSGLPPLVGLIPVRYEGEGTLHMKNPVDKGETVSEHGINFMEVARQFEEGGLDLPGLQEEDIHVIVITEGPMAYVTLVLQQGKSVTFTGSIVGVSAEQKIEIAPLIPDAGQQNKQVEKTKTTCTENADGSYDYDMDGDGKIDFTLYPLITK